jgi:hypothetical protein
MTRPSTCASRPPGSDGIAAARKCPGKPLLRGVANERCPDALRGRGTREAHRDLASAAWDRHAGVDVEGVCRFAGVVDDLADGFGEQQQAEGERIGPTLLLGKRLLANRTKDPACLGPPIRHPADLGHAKDGAIHAGLADVSANGGKQADCPFDPLPRRDRREERGFGCRVSCPPTPTQLHWVGQRSAGALRILDPVSTQGLGELPPPPGDLKCLPRLLTSSRHRHAEGRRDPKRRVLCVGQREPAKRVELSVATRSIRCEVGLPAGRLRVGSVPGQRGRARPSRLARGSKSCGG